jgi:hypothetical protein
MGVPQTFLAFQKLFEQIGDTTDVKDDNGGLRKSWIVQHDAPDRTDKRDDLEARIAQDPNLQVRVLGFAADAILADLHNHELLRDAVMDSLPNTANNSLLFMINPTLDAVDPLIEFLREHPRIEKYALGARKLNDGERVRAIKIQVVPVEDECESPDSEAEDEKRKEQEMLAQLGADDSNTQDVGLQSNFFRV